MKYQVSPNDFYDFWSDGENTTSETPAAAVFSFLAIPGRKGRIGLRIGYIQGLDRFVEGQLFQVGKDPSKAVRFVCTAMAHGHPDPEEWFTVMHVEPVSCECADLNNVFLVGFETKANTQSE
ncbi:hypothetical protein LOC68_14125 [Blastopirellula sp. JC732]|uniref:Uncharacterized protein n=1 Tax=Blastopirellula sediminis TaxID=2894196 RepID=A0A9X1MP82_9BACT|nr:hypothetical protein [Blastopirellula sediminis]MCC9607180.1 hypothetical protein [Blastopirellula sediminis]MCC9629527.1 hypothetical protein [Blastopirellula sediminis]